MQTPTRKSQATKRKALFILHRYKDTQGQISDNMTTSSMMTSCLFDIYYGGLHIGGKRTGERRYREKVKHNKIRLDWSCFKKQRVYLTHFSEIEVPPSFQNRNRKDLLSPSAQESFLWLSSHNICISSHKFSFQEWAV